MNFVGKKGPNHEFNFPGISESLRKRPGMFLDMDQILTFNSQYYQLWMKAGPWMHTYFLTAKTTINELCQIFHPFENANLDLKLTISVCTFTCMCGQWINKAVIYTRVFITIMCIHMMLLNGRLWSIFYIEVNHEEGNWIMREVEAKLLKMNRPKEAECFEFITPLQYLENCFVNEDLSEL